MIQPIFRLADWLRNRRRARTDSPEAANGKHGEDLAQRYLQKRGLTIVARNWRSQAGPGELDLVAWHGDKLVFVEVKTRVTDEFGAPERAVDREKQRHLRRAAGEYARRAGVEWLQVRFDVVGIVLSTPPLVEWIQDAFPASQTL
ncbi:MAG TPA: YraN family protein [Bryobacteraceae bacterium]|nr:YraN family protein [Bryobacteraceae bacterium]